MVQSPTPNRLPAIPSEEEELENDEGFRRVPYKDTKGIWTNGVGCNLASHKLLGKDGKPLSMDPWSDAEIFQHLDEDIASAWSEIDKHIPWVRRMDQIRSRVVLNMMFNMGWPVLSQFKNTLRYMQVGLYGEAADGMANSLWAKQVKGRATRLIARMRTGHYFN